MTINYTEAKVTFSREWPDPVVFDPTQIQGTRILINEPGFWTGDRVTITTTSGGLPFDEDAIIGLTTSIDCYIRRDALGRCTFYTTQLGAVNGDRYPFQIPVKTRAFGAAVLAHYYDNATYRGLLLTVATALNAVTIPGGQAAIIDMPTVNASALSIRAIAADPEIRGWKIQCDLDQIQMEESTEMLPTTKISAEFPTFDAGMISGQGVFTGGLANDWAAGEISSLMMLRLNRMTRKGAAATMRIQVANSLVIMNGDEATRKEYPIYHEARILFYQTSIDIQSGQITGFSGSFLTTGEIKIVDDVDRVATDDTDAYYIISGRDGPFIIDGGA